LETRQLRFLSYADAFLIHFELMQLLGETSYGIFDRSLVESALARPRHAAAYEDADVVRQAATLCFGLIKSHPWIVGNKRTAIALTNEFLFRNGLRITASLEEKVQMGLYVESDLWGVSEIEIWMRSHTLERV
jgi:death on curing protein